MGRGAAQSLEAMLSRRVDLSMLEGHSLMIFGADNVWRHVAFFISVHPYFEFCIYILILTNAIMMILVRPPPLDDPESQKVMVFGILDDVVLFCFTGEMALRMIALNAFFGTHAYWKNNWYKMDFLIILSSYIGKLPVQILPLGKGILVFRVFRAIRILRAIKFFKGIKAIMNALKEGAGLVFDNAIFMLFFFLVFGVLAVEFFKNSLSRWCVMEEDYAHGKIVWPLLATACGFDTETDELIWTNLLSHTLQGNCPEDMICLDMSNLAYYYGYASYDDAWHALIMTLQISTLSSWTEHAYHLQEAENWLGVALYMFLLVFLLNFVCVSLFVAVIGHVYYKNTKETDDMVRHPALYDLKYDPDVQHRVDRQRKIDLTVRWGSAADAIEKSCEAWGMRDGSAPHNKKEEPRIGQWELIRRNLYPYIESRESLVVVAALIVTNVGIQATLTADILIADHRGNSHYQHVLDVCELVFTCVFWGELLIRFLVLGDGSLGKFFLNPWHKVDTGVSVLSLFTLVFLDQSVSFFRMLRLLQLLYFYEGFAGLATLMSKSASSLPNTFDLLIFIAFSFFVFSLAGVQFFGAQLVDPDTGGRTRLHFDHFFSGLLLLFKVMTGDSWEWEMRALWHAAGLKGVGFICLFYMWSVWVLVNLFTAIVLDSFGEADADKYEEQKRDYDEIQRKELIRMTRKRSDSKMDSRMNNIRARMAQFLILPQAILDDRKKRSQDSLDDELQDIDPFHLHAMVAGHVYERRGAHHNVQSDLIDLGTGGLSDVEWNATVILTKNRRDKHAQFLENGYAARVVKMGHGARHEQIQVNLPMAACVNEADMVLKSMPADAAAVRGFACFCLGPHNKLRRHIMRVVDSRGYEIFMVFWVFVSTVALVFEPPTEATEAEWDKVKDESGVTSYSSLRQIDLFFLAIFGTEFLFKSIAKGFLPQSSGRGYLDDSWNVLDFLLLAAMVAALAIPQLKVIQSCRTLRPIRILRKIESLRVMVAAVWGAIPHTVLIALLTNVLFLLFAMYAVGQFGAKLNYCTDSTATGVDDCHGQFENDYGVRVPRAWLTPAQNFDTIGKATFTLIEVSSLASWSACMFMTMDITEIDKQPEFMSSPVNSLFFVILILAVSFFMVNIFVAVILDKINDEMGTGILTAAQKAWADYQRTMEFYESKVNSAKPPDETADDLRLLLYQMVTHKSFEPVIITLISINVCFMCSSHASEPDWWSASPSNDYPKGGALFWIDLIFLVIYSIEMMIKVIAYGGVREYVKSPWNSFDGFVVIAGAATLLMENYMSAKDGGIWLSALGVVRMLRISRIFKLMTASKGIKVLFRTLLLSLPEIFNITFLAFLLVFVYTVFGKQVFGQVKFQSQVNQHANFLSSGNGLWLVFRILTLDNWHLLSHDFEVQWPYCTAVENGVSIHNGADWNGPGQYWNDCGHPITSKVFFLTFYLVGVYVFLNLVIAVILDKFGHIFSEESFSLGEDHLYDFDDLWCLEDPKGRGEIARWQVRNIVGELYKRGNPLGCDLLGVEGIEGRKRWRFILLDIAETHGNRKNIKDKLRVFIRFRELLTILCHNHVHFFHLECLTYEEKKVWENTRENIEQQLAAHKIVSWCIAFNTMKQVERRLGPKICVIKKIREYLFWRKAAEVAKAQGKRIPPPPAEKQALLRAQGMLEDEEKGKTVKPEQASLFRFGKAAKAQKRQEAALAAEKAAQEEAGRPLLGGGGREAMAMARLPSGMQGGNPPDKPRSAGASGLSGAGGSGGGGGGFFAMQEGGK